MGSWYRGGHKVSCQEPERVLTRGELQRSLSERISRGDEKARALWAEWKRVDRLLDVFRDKPLYPPATDEDKNKV